MRLWSLHPEYLDSRGLTSVWREGLLAKAVLLGQTKGYTRHPQLQRFTQHPKPLDAIDYYLEQILSEAENRGYHFDARKIRCGLSPQKMPVTLGQLKFELAHLKNKLGVRNPERLGKIKNMDTPEVNHLFTIIPGEIEPWEKGNL